MNISDRAVYTRDGDENLQLMESYINGQIFEPGLLEPASQDEEDIKKQLMKKADYRFLHLKLLREMLHLSRLEDIRPSSSGSRLMEQYLSSLADRYGEKYFRRVLDFLLTLAVAPVPLTIRELAFLLGEEGYRVDHSPTFRLLACLADLRGFIKVERSYRPHHLLFLSHEDWEKALKEQYGSEMESKVSQWIKETLVLAGKDLPWREERFDGETYLLAHIWNLVEEYAPGRKQELMENMEGELEDVAEVLRNQPPVIYLLERGVNVYGAVAETKMELETQGRLLDRNDLARVLMNRANVLYELTRYEEALGDYNRAVEIIEELESQGRLLDPNALAWVLKFRGELLYRLGRKAEAIDDYVKCADILEAISPKKRDVSLEKVNYTVASLKDELDTSE